MNEIKFTNSMINLALIKTSFTKEAIDNEELDERTTQYENPLLDIPDEPMDEALPDSDSKEVREKVLAFPDLQHAVYIFTNMADEIFDQLKKRKNLNELKIIVNSDLSNPAEKKLYLDSLNAIFDNINMDTVDENEIIALDIFKKVSREINVFNSKFTDKYVISMIYLIMKYLERFDHL
jgi:hypothetical protein